MNIREEKNHIYSLMNDITNERNRLTEAYVLLLSRLNTLTEIEQKNDVVDIVDTESHNEDNKEGSLIDIINNHNKRFSMEEDNNITKDIIPKVEIEKEKDKLPKNPKTISYSKIEGLIISVLKEAGKPIKTKELYREVCKRTDYSIEIANFRNNMLPRVYNNNKKVNRAMHGYYQYLNTTV